MLNRHKIYKQTKVSFFSYPLFVSLQ